jgi:hypothetical protein
MTAQETKDVETCLAGIRTDKLKAEREAVKEKKGKWLSLQCGVADAGNIKNFEFQSGFWLYIL